MSVYINSTGVNLKVTSRGVCSITEHPQESRIGIVHLKIHRYFTGLVTVIDLIRFYSYVAKYRIGIRRIVTVKVDKRNIITVSLVLAVFPEIYYGAISICVRVRYANIRHDSNATCKDSAFNGRVNGEIASRSVSTNDEINISLVSIKVNGTCRARCDTVH